MNTTIIQDLYDHGDWANQKLLDLCEGLSDAQLDQPREMGFGTLRKTLFHILEAENLWLERWQGKPWRPLIADAGGRSIEQLRQQMSATATARNELIASESTTHFSRVVDFQDSAAAAWSFPVGDLLLHVSNHGIHHRAQVLSFLRGFERRVPAGVDYIFWKLARPSCELPPESLAPLRGYGLEAASAPGNAPQLDPDRLDAYFQYADWAMEQVFQAASNLAEKQLDRRFEMGMGSLRKNLQHVIDAERWWLANWSADLSPFPPREEPRTLEALRAQYQQVSQERMKFVHALDDVQANRIVYVTAGGPKTCVRVIESLLQLCSHGTHHRAQVLNMMRSLNAQPPGIDLVVWLRNSA